MIRTLLFPGVSPYPAISSFTRTLTIVDGAYELRSSLQYAVRAVSYLLLLVSLGDGFRCPAVSVFACGLLQLHCSIDPCCCCGDCCSSLFARSMLINWQRLTFQWAQLRNDDGVCMNVRIVDNLWFDQENDRFIFCSHDNVVGAARLYFGWCISSVTSNRARWHGAVIWLSQISEQSNFMSLPNIYRSAVAKILCTRFTVLPASDKSGGWFFVKQV